MVRDFESVVKAIEEKIVAEEARIIPMFNGITSIDKASPRGMAVERSLNRIEAFRETLAIINTNK